MSIEELSDQQQVRRDKLAALREEGYPFPNDVRLTSCAAGARATATEQNALEISQRRVDTIAGRVMQIRLMGKAAFCHIQDISGKLQVYVKRDEVGEEAFAKFKKFDLGDIVEVKGYGFLTKTDEPSLHATAIRLLVKCLHPLPEKFHGLTDIEIRYRQRYLDLIMNPEVKKAFLARSKIIATMRKFFNERLFVEVETPVLNTAASGAAAKPFRTHHNALDMDLSLRIAPELSLKKLVVGGLERVYEIGRVFRNEGISTQHNPEFTMIEFYQAYATYEDLMELTEELFTLLCKEVTGGLEIEYSEKKINFSRPWQRLSMVDAIYELGGISRDIDLLTLEGIHQAAKILGISSALATSDYGMAVYLVFDEAIECKIVNPTFITRHPLSVSPLARPAMDDGRFTDRFELMICGMEVANGFSELNDADDQRARMDVQLAMKAKGDEEAMELDEDFLKALEYGLPPTAGQGIGVDRLVMLLTQSPSIRDVILFPTLRPL